jgi:hypothetical protein
LFWETVRIENRPGQFEELYPPRSFDFACQFPVQFSFPEVPSCLQEKAKSFEAVTDSRVLVGDATTVGSFASGQREAAFWPDHIVVGVPELCRVSLLTT